MNSTKYHKDIFLPANFRQIPERTIKLDAVTRHAKRAKNDRYGRIFIPGTLTWSGEDIIEVEIKEGTIKLVIRQEYAEDKDYHICYVLLFVDGYPIVKTVWLNSRYDTHKSLDTTPYYDPFPL